MKFNLRLFIEIMALSMFYYHIMSSLGAPNAVLLSGGFIIGFFGDNIFSWLHGSKQTMFMPLTDENKSDKV